MFKRIYQGKEVEMGTFNFTEEQLAAINENGNVLVIANAGSGKTSTLIEKIQRDANAITDHKVVAVMTFTNKATSEIKKRIQSNNHNFYIGTLHSFVLQNVIIPFGREIGLSKECSPKMNYSVKSNCRAVLMNKFRESGEIGCYRDDNKNFFFELATFILEKSLACAKFLYSKYAKFFIDEFQDCDRDMYKFFLKVNNRLHIPLFLVGDPKQSIYQWRGACPKIIDKVRENKNFKVKFLKRNFRSKQQIQNFSNLFFQDCQRLFRKCDDNSSIIWVSAKKDWKQVLENTLNTSEIQNCALLRRTNSDAENCLNKLKGLNQSFELMNKDPLNTIQDEDKWFYVAMAKQHFDPRYTFYNFLDDIPLVTDFIKINELKNIFNSINIHLGESKYRTDVHQLASKLGFTVQESSLNTLIKAINDKKSANFYKSRLPAYICMTIHSAKGLEFDCVVVFPEDFNIDVDEDLFLNYVAVSRAKKKLILVSDSNSTEFKRSMRRKYGELVQRQLKQQNLKLKDIMTIEMK